MTFDPEGVTSLIFLIHSSSSSNYSGNRGRYQDRVEFIFDNVSLGQTFTIGRPVQAVVGVAAELEILRPTAPYEPPKPRVREPEGQVIEGERPSALAKINWVVTLPEAGVPDYIPSALERGVRTEQIQRVQRILLPRVLNEETYGKHWKTLLWVEEFQMKSVQFNYAPVLSNLTMLNLELTCNSTI